MYCECHAQDSVEHMLNCPLAAPLLPFLHRLGHHQIMYQNLFLSPHLVMLVLLMTKRLGPDGQLTSSVQQGHTHALRQHRRCAHLATFQHSFDELVLLIEYGKLWPMLRPLSAVEETAALAWLRRDEGLKHGSAS